MKNIHELLKECGIEIPSEKREAFDKSLFENYKTVEEIERVKGALKTAEDNLAKRDNDLNELKKQMGDNTEASTKLAELQKKYDAEAEAHKAELANQRYEFMVKDFANTLKFSSNSAKKAFTTDLLNKKLVVEGDKLLGAEDFVKVYKEQDAGAFAVDTGAEAEAPQVRVGGKTDVNNNNNQSGKVEFKPFF